jgi:putative hydrolase of the HAD superfamily
MNSARPIRAVTLDVGGTLIRPWPSVGHVYAEVAALQGYHALDADQLNRRFATAWRQRTNFAHSRADWAALVEQTFTGLGESARDEKLFEALYHRFESPEVWRIYDDVLAALKGLTRRGIKLAVVSNWDERLRPLLARLQLERYFEAIVVSCEIGCAKPFPGIFERAAQLLDVTPGDMLHVGDSAEEDFAGAKAAGLHGLLINRQGTRPSREEIRSLREIEGRLPSAHGGICLE